MKLKEIRERNYNVDGDIRYEDPNVYTRKNIKDMKELCKKIKAFECVLSDDATISLDCSLGDESKDGNDRVPYLFIYDYALGYIEFTLIDRLNGLYSLSVYHDSSQIDNELDKITLDEVVNYLKSLIPIGQTTLKDI